MGLRPLWRADRDSVGVTTIVADDGTEGQAIGGGLWGAGYLHRPTQAEIDEIVKPLLLGEDPLDRERLWQEMSWHRGFAEGLVGNIDCALWDLAGRAAGMPVAKMLGGRQG